MPPKESHGNFEEGIGFYSREGLVWGAGSDPCKAVEDLVVKRSKS
jgi:hypothetical protein